MSLALSLGIRTLRSSSNGSMNKFNFSAIVHANTLYPFAKSRVFSCTRGTKGHVTLYEGTNQDVRKNYIFGHMLFTLTLEQQRLCPKVIVDVVSIQHGKIGISVYHCVQTGDTYSRTTLLADQSFTIRRISALTSTEIEKNINALFRSQRKIMVREEEHQELSDICEKLISKTSSLDAIQAKVILSKAEKIEEKLNSSVRADIDYDSLRTELLDIEDDFDNL